MDFDAGSVKEQPITVLFKDVNGANLIYFPERVDH